MDCDEDEGERRRGGEEEEEEEEEEGSRHLLSPVLLLGQRDPVLERLQSNRHLR